MGAAQSAGTRITLDRHGPDLELGFLDAAGESFSIVLSHRGASSLVANLQLALSNADWRSQVDVGSALNRSRKKAT